MVIPCDIRELEHAKFKNDTAGDVCVRVCDAEALAVLEDILLELGGAVVAVNTYNDISALASATNTTIVSYTVPAGKNLEVSLVEFGGENIATYTVEIDSTVEAKRRTYFGGQLSDQFVFTKLKLTAGQVITLKVIHGRSMVADFEGRILGLLSNV